MKLIPDNKTRAAVYLGVILVGGGIAAYLLLAQRHEPPPDPATQAIQERAEAIQSSMSTRPQTPDLPVEQRAPRGAITK
jgi:hypothetical protein